MKINLRYLSIWTFNLNIHKKCNLSLKKNNNEGNLIMKCFSPIHFGNSYLHPFVQCFLQPVFAKIKALHFLLECLMRLENTWQVTRDIPSSRISPDPSDSQLLLFSSPHSSSTGFRSENTGQEIRDIPSSRITPDLQIHSFFSSVHLTHLLQGSGQRTRRTS